MWRRLLSGALLAAGLCNAWSQPARAAGLDAVRIYTDDDPPYVMVGADGKVAGGTTVEKVTRVMRKLGLPFSALEAVPWARAYQEAKTRPYAMVFPIAKTRERLKYLDFTFKIIDAEVYFYWLKTRSDIQLASLEDAKKHSVCVVRNDYRQEYLESEGFLRLDVAGDTTDNVKKLLSGRCDLIVSTETGMLSKLKALNAERALLTRGMRLDKLDSALYAAFNKGTPPDVIARFRAAAAEVE
ncbi:substrate-binding periplasmic protein [Chromobacterium subtsugae]|uniref:substrate-binding periplasmic protein n=1 Tax=Chromobacterium subtsugae TaxID=251747 RepID=UPI0009BA4870|nr:transporter substrate-binding domain-containing protein [Chromobacterium subtsugae]